MFDTPDPRLHRGVRPFIAMGMGQHRDVLRCRFIHDGAVFDFIQVHAGPYYWPAFNIADSAISIGAAMLVWHALFGGRGRTTYDKTGTSR